MYNPNYVTDDLILYNLYKENHPREEAQCPECKSQNIYFDDIRAETSCKDCGLVLYADYDYVAGFKVNYPFKHIKPEQEDNSPESIKQALIANWRKWLEI